MNHGVTAKDRFKAYMMVSPIWTLIYAFAATIGIGRAFYVYFFLGLDIESGFELLFGAIGLFTPWFLAWVAVLLFGVLLETERDRIDSKARQIASSRQVTEKE